MPTNILMPALSPTMEEGRLAKWLKAEGDAITAGDVIAEIETDKATMEVEAVDEGRLARIMVPEGTEGVKVNAVIAILAEEDEQLAAASAAAVPGLTRDLETPAAGAAAVPGSTRDLETAARPNGTRVFASPLARRIARDKGLDLATLKGSGPHGRIVKADVETIAAAPARGAAPQATSPPPPAGADADAVRKLYAGRAFEEHTLDTMRKIIAARLVEAKSTIPHFYLRRDIRLDELIRVRARTNARAAAHGVKLSVNDYIIKAAALALQQVPDCNAVWAGDRILRFAASDVAVAVAVEGGLFTPVIRDAETKPLSAISTEMKDLAGRARARRLAPQDYQGGSLAISNLGMFGIDSFDAVINPPHAAILAVGAGVAKPLIEAGEIVPATVMSVTLSVDHRVIDGALGARFLDAVASFLEDPATMLL